MKNLIFDKEQKYDTRQTFRLSTDEKNMLKEEANKIGLDVSNFIRICINKFIEGGK